MTDQTQSVADLFAREEEIALALRHYLDTLEHDSPIVSSSHIVYGRYARRFGDDFRRAVDRHFGRA